MVMGSLDCKSLGDSNWMAGDFTPSWRGEPQEKLGNFDKYGEINWMVVQLNFVSMHWETLGYIQSATKVVFLMPCGGRSLALLIVFFYVFFNISRWSNSGYLLVWVCLGLALCIGPRVEKACCLIIDFSAKAILMERDDHEVPSKSQQIHVNFQVNHV